MARYLIFAASSAIGQSVVELQKKQGDEVLTTAQNTNKITPDFIARAILFFLHPESSWITGQVLAVDGG